MKRRNFIEASAVSGAFLALNNNNIAEAAQIKPKNTALSANEKLAGYSLKELTDLYKYDLLDDCLPFYEKYLNDYEYGGFLCNTDRDGAHISTKKRTWFIGRGIWVNSYLYNEIEKNPKHLEIAQKSVDFLMKKNPLGKDFWPVEFTREGEPIGGPDKIFYGDMFVAEGLQEFSKASGDPRLWNMAKEIMMKCIDIYDNQPDYANIEPKDNVPGVTRPRILGHWFMLLNSSTQMLAKKRDADIEKVAKRCIDAIMNHHYNPAYDLINEYTNHDMSHIQNVNGDVVVGHSPETLWMVMAEALRTKDKDLFNLTAERLRHHAEVLWDDVYGGFLLGLNDVEKNVWDITKAVWLHQEILIGTLCVIEHTGDEWAKEWFSKTFKYCREKFVLKQYGFPLWIAYADRKVTFEKHYDRVENYHHPRHLMKNLLALERIKSRGGKTSGIFG